MKRFSKRLMALVLVLALALSVLPPISLAASEPLRVLTIGNSHSLDSTWILAQVFQAQNPNQELILGTMYYSGCSMAQHVSFSSGDKPNYSYYKNVDNAWTTTTSCTLATALADEPWDIVVMQEMNTLAGQASTFQNDNIQTLMDYVNSHLDNTPVFYWNMVWANPIDPDFWAPDYTPQPPETWIERYIRLFDTDQVHMYELMTENVQRYIETNPAFDTIFQSGTAIQYANHALGQTDRDLYRDYTHISDFSRVMVAYLWYTKITGEPLTQVNLDTVPQNLRHKYFQKYGDLTITDEMKQVIVDAVNYTLENPYQVPDPPVDELRCDHCRYEPEWTAWSGGTLQAVDGHYYLTKDVTLSNTISLTGADCDITINLNGHTLTHTGRAFSVGDGVTLGIMDSVGTGKITAAGVSGQEGDVALVSDGGALHIHGGTLTGTGSVISATGGTLGIHGGTVTDNDTATTQDVLISQGAALEASGGTLSSALVNGTVSLTNRTVIDRLTLSTTGDLANRLTVSGVLMGSVGLAVPGAVDGMDLGTDCGSSFRKDNFHLLDNELLGVVADGTDVYLSQKTYCEHCQENVLWWPSNTASLEASGHYDMAAGHYRLTEDTRVVQKQINSREDNPGNFCVDLAGHTLTGETRAFLVYDQATLNVFDSVGGGILESEAHAALGGGVLYTYAGGTINIYGGTVRHNTVNADTLASGGLIIGNGGTINIYGGTLNGTNVNSYGGAVYIYGNGTLKLQGGTVTAGSAGSAGNCIYIGTGSKVILSEDPDIEQITFPKSTASTLTVQGSFRGNVELQYLHTQSIPELTDLGNSENAEISQANITITNAPGKTLAVKGTDLVVSASNHPYGNCPKCGEVRWTPLTDAQADAMDKYGMIPGHYILVEDIKTGQKQLNYDGTTPGAVCIDLNGHTFCGSHRTFLTYAGSELNIIDSVGTGIVEASPTVNVGGGVVYAYADSTIRIYGGTFRHSESAADYCLSGGIALANGGNIELYGGTLVGAPVSTYGGAVYLTKNGSFYAAGGTVIPGTADTAAECIYAAGAQIIITGDPELGKITFGKGYTNTLTVKGSFSGSTELEYLDNREITELTALGVSDGAELSKSNISFTDAEGMTLAVKGTDLVASESNLPYGICDACGEVRWTPITDAQMDAMASSGLTPGHYILIEDVDTAQIVLNRDGTASGTYCIDLNGHTLRGPHRTFLTYAGADLNIMDSVGTGIVEAKATAAVSGGLIYAYPDSTVSIYGGTYRLHANAADTIQAGGIATGKGGNISIYGGTLQGTGVASYGGAVYVCDGGTFYAEGGTVISGTAAKAGDCVYIAAGSTARIAGDACLGGLTFAEQSSDTLTVLDSFTGSLPVEYPASLTLTPGMDLGNCTGAFPGTVTLADYPCFRPAVSGTDLVVASDTVHTPVSDKAVAATCTETGLTAGSHCQLCGQVLVAQQVTPALGHSSVTDQAVAPTCTKTGLTEGSHCSRCGVTLTAQQVVPATGHTEQTTSGTPATCTQPGLTDGVKCSVCGEILTPQKPIPATGHSYRGDKCTTCGATDPNYEPAYWVGFSRVDINPYLVEDDPSSGIMALPLRGTGDVWNRLSTNGLTDDTGDGVIDEEDGLKATCVAITDKDGKTVLLITTDLIGGTMTDQVRPVVLERVNNAIADGTLTGLQELRPEDIHYTGTHTHSAPDTTVYAPGGKTGTNNDGVDLSVVNEQLGIWIDRTLEDLADAAMEALQDQSAAQLKRDQLSLSNATSGVLQDRVMTTTRHYFTDVDGDELVTGDGFNDIKASMYQNPSDYKTNKGRDPKQVTQMDDTIYLMCFEFENDQKLPVILTGWRGHPSLNNSDAYPNSSVNHLSADYVSAFRTGLEYGCDVTYDPTNGYITGWEQGTTQKCRVAFFSGTGGNANPRCSELIYYSGSNGEVAQRGYTWIDNPAKAGPTRTRANLYGTVLAAFAQECIGDGLNETITEAGTIQTAQMNYYAQRNTTGITELSYKAALACQEAMSKGTVTYPFRYTDPTTGEVFLIGNRFQPGSIVAKWDKNRQAPKHQIVQMELNVIMLGQGAAFATVPAEPFDFYYRDTTLPEDQKFAPENNLWNDLIDNDTYGKPFILGYCNDAMGYIPNSEAYVYCQGSDRWVVGSYEAQTSPVEQGTGETMVRIFDEMLSNLSANGSMSYTAACPHCGEAQTWQPYNNQTTLTTGHYYLVEDSFSNQIKIEGGQTVCLDLKGHTFQGLSRAIYTNDATKDILNILDSSPEQTGVIQGCGANCGAGAGFGGGTILVAAGDEMNLYSGTITTYEVPAYSILSGGTLRISGTFNQYGGTVVGGTASSFSGSYLSGSTVKTAERTARGGTVALSGTMNLYGGTITEGKLQHITGTVTQNADGVNVYTQTVRPMDGNGPCIYADAGSTIRLYGDAAVQHIQFADAKGLFVGGSYTGTTELKFDAVPNPVALTDLGDCGPDAQGTSADVSGATITLTDAPGKTLAVKGTDLVVSDHPDTYGTCPACGDCQWIPVTDAQLDAMDRYGMTPGHYILTEDVGTVQKQLNYDGTTPGTYCVDLNGHIFTGTTRAFLAYAGAELNIFDSVGTGILTATPSAAIGGGVIYAYPDATVSIYGGTLRRGTANAEVNQCGGLIIGNGGAIRIHGGTLEGSTVTSYGGTVYLYGNGSFYADGGILTAGTAGTAGDCVYLATGCTAEIAGDASVAMLTFAGSSADTLTIHSDFTGAVTLKYPAKVALTPGTDIGNSTGAFTGTLRLADYPCLLAQTSGTELVTASGTGHTEVIDKAVAATCTAAGLTEGKHCSLCGAVLAAQEVVPALGHSYEAAVTTAPGCTSAGVKTYTCTTCGDSYTESLPATGHSEQTIPGTAATCTEPGLTDGLKCTVCGEILTAQETIPATGHSYADGICSVCGAVDPDYVPPVVQPTLTLRYPTLTFEDVITMNVFFEASNLGDVVEMGLITYKSEVSEWNVDNAEVVVPGYIWDESQGFYCANTAGIPAKEMGDTYWFAVYAKLSDGSYTYTRLVSYSPARYAYGQLSDPQMSRLVVAMLNYGAAAQVYFNYRTDSLMNADLTEAQQASVETYRAEMMNGISTPSAEKAANFTRTSTGFASRYPTITFDGAFCIDYYCQPNRTVSGDITLYYWDQTAYDECDVLTVENATGSLIMAPDGNQYATSVEGIAAKDLDKGIYVAFVYSNGTETYCSGILGYSIGVYCVGLASGTDSMAPFAQATAVYGYYAKQVFNEAA